MILGIDQGTTSTRAVLVDDELQIRASAQLAHAQHTPRPGWVEHDPRELWANTERVIAEVLAGGERPTAVAIANQGETVMLWDARTGAPLHHAIVWSDTRTEAALGRYAAHDALIRDATGLRLDSYFSAPKLAWLLDETPGARALAAAGHLRTGTIDTWLVDRLTAGAVFATDASTAARTLLAETSGCIWHPALLDAFGIPPGILAEIRDCDAAFGTCAIAGLHGVPIAASIVDQPAALLGHGCVDRGDVKATFGTGCFVYANTGHERPRGEGTLATIAWRRGGQTTYALDGGVLSVGSAIEWAAGLGIPVGRPGLTTRPDAPVFGPGPTTQTDAPFGPALAPRADAPVFVPALAGLGAPHWDRGARGAWLGLTTATTADELSDAIAEGLACRVVEVVRAIERDAGLTVATLRADGGLARSSALMQRVADLLGAPLAVAAEEEATVVGACALVLLARGTVRLADLRRRRARSQAQYEPRIGADERSARIARADRAMSLARQWR